MADLGQKIGRWSFAIGVMNGLVGITMLTTGIGINYFAPIAILETASVIGLTGYKISEYKNEK